MNRLVTFPRLLAVLLGLPLCTPGSFLRAAGAQPAAEDPVRAAGGRPAELSQEPDLTVAPGFPVWLRRPGSGSNEAGRPLNVVLVILEGFDLGNTMNARELVRRFRRLADALRERGVDILVVDYPDAQRAPDELAPLATEAIRAAATLSHRTVAVLGISSGGIVGRWALAAAEGSDSPLPVHAFITLDAPHRGFTFNPGLQAMAARYGSADEQRELRSPAVRALFRCRPEHVRWKTVGGLGLSRKVPARWDEDRSGCEEFFGRLARLNVAGGWPSPERCQVFIVSSASRAGRGGGAQLLHLWLPFGAQWTLRGDDDDRAPGALLPPEIVRGFRVRYPMRIAGSAMRSAPTFLATESALDAAAGEEPSWPVRYAPRDPGLPPIAHGEVDLKAGEYVGKKLMASFYSSHADEYLPPTGR